MDWNLSNVLELIEKFEEIIEKSKSYYRNLVKVVCITVMRIDSFQFTEMDSDPVSKFKYSDLNKKIELFSEIYYISVVKLSMSGVVLPAFFLTSINYFIYDMGDDSFFLSYPIVCV